MTVISKNVIYVFDSKGKIMKLNDIHKEWSVDSKIDKGYLDDEAIKIPLLHSKYLNILSETRLEFKKILEGKKKLESTLDDYFQGKIDGKVIGREPWQLEETKAAIEKRISSDKDIIRVNLQIAEIEEKVLVLKEIINNLNQRNFQLKVAMDFMKWSNGN